MTAPTLTAEPEVVADRRRGPELAGHLIFAACALVSAGYLLYLGRRTSFFFDEWNWIQSRRGWRWGAIAPPRPPLWLRKNRRTDGMTFNPPQSSALL